MRLTEPELPSADVPPHPDEANRVNRGRADDGRTTGPDALRPEARPAAPPPAGLPFRRVYLRRADS
jgi:hypothetical protein